VGQEEIINLLKRFKGQWLTHKQIKNLLKCNICNISPFLERLRKHSKVKYKPNPKGRGGKGGLSYLYSLK